LIDDCDIVHAHIFPYSPRVGTPAARMPQVAPALRKARAAALREAAARRRSAWLAALVGTTQSVLVERPGTRGHAENFADVALPCCRVGHIVEAKVTGIRDGRLLCTPALEAAA